MKPKKNDSFLCIGGYNDGKYLRYYNGPKVQVAKPIKLGVLKGDEFEKMVVKSILKAHCYELEEFRYPPNKSVYFWRWDQMTLDEMIYKLIKNYGVPREEVGY